MSERAVLEAFHRVLRLETHNLARWPQILWQQAYNELQWDLGDADPVLAEELSRRTDRGARPWLRRRTRLRQASELVQVIDAHEGRVDDCAVGPDRSWIASASYDGTVKVWSPETGQELRVLHHDAPVGCCIASPDGSFLMTASGGVLQLWDPRTGREIRRLEPHEEGGIGSCALSPDASFAVGVVGSRADPNNFGLKVWEVSSGRVVRRLQGKEAIFACAVAPDASFVVSAGGARSDRVVIWDLAKGKPRRKLKGHEPAPGQARGQVLDCAIAPDGSFIVSAGDDFRLRIWDPTTGRELRRLGAPPDTTDPSLLADFEHIVHCCAVSPDGSWIAAGYEDKAVRLWETRTGDELRTLEGHEDQVTACAVAADGSLLVTGDMTGALRIWSLEAEADVLEPERHRGEVFDCAFAPDGSFVVSAGADATLKVWDPEASGVLRTLAGHQLAASACAVFPDARVIASAGYDGTIRLWGSDTGDLLRVMQPPVRDPDPLGVTGRVNACDVSPDTSFLVSAQGFFQSVWDPRQGHEVVGLEHAEPGGGRSQVNDCAVSPDASYVVSARSGRGGLWLWDPATGEEIRRLGSDGASACAVAPDGSFIVSTGEGRPKLWDPESGDELLALGGEDGSSIGSCAVTADARFVVTGGAALRVWDAGSGSEVAMIPIPGAVASVDVHPSEPFVVCGDSTGNVNLIELSSVDLGPLVVTPYRAEGVVRIQCPACLTRFTVEALGVLGREVDCPKCGRALRLNTFVLERPTSRSSTASTGDAG